MGADDRDDCGPDGHTFAVTQLDVADFRLRRVLACCRCGAVSYEPSVLDYSADTPIESRQPLVERHDAHPDIG